MVNYISCKGMQLLPNLQVNLIISKLAGGSGFTLNFVLQAKNGNFATDFKELHINHEK